MGRDQSLDQIELLAYADGHLDCDPAVKARVEQRIRDCPETWHQAQSYKAQTLELRRAFSGPLDEPVPDRLLASLHRDAERPRRRWLHAAAVALLIATTSVSGWLIGRSERQVEWSPQQFLQQSYEGYMESANRLQLTTHGEPLNWLSDEISLTLRVPDLSDQGYRVVDKRTVNDGEHRMVRIIYASTDGRSFSLFLRPRWGERRSQLRLKEGPDVSLAYWLDGPLASAIASSLSADETRAVADAVRSALRDPASARPRIRLAPRPPPVDGGTLATGVQPPPSSGQPNLPVAPRPSMPDTPG